MADYNKHIILCADDFALLPSISTGITALANKQRISATSCITTTPHWENDAQMLNPLWHKIDIGLHINFTDGKALVVNPFATTQTTFCCLEKVLLRALTWRTDKQALRREINAQLDAFVDMTGHLPDFIDGHQHVHHLPAVAEVIQEIYTQRLNKSNCYIRSVYPFVAYTSSVFSKQRIKEAVITYTGAKKMRTSIKRNNIPSPRCFAGIYDFCQVDHFPEIMTFWLKNVPDSTLIMCHPGHPAADNQDILSNSRHKELLWLESEALANILYQLKIVLSRFSRVC
ncbi:MAG: ChbG/HpnK family deacetylase [Endozoicomonadaceae bacterium]|nr:ChbG/HpnK family deacetylase [Endozoicomonadaceae bacterium]